MALIKRPHPDRSLDRFDRGAGVLSSEHGFEGHVFTARSSFWSPFSPLRLQWWIFYVVVWSDSVWEPVTEDYPPFTAVNEMKDGYLIVDSEDPSRAGRYEVRWLTTEEAIAARTVWSVGDNLM
ncbi:hypothetical protein Q9S71_14880 [Microbacterium sp. KSW4-11]|uniref:Uncharacterized protein n=1 Tax=Microbacterium gawkjiense TaxID=3067309 RepID=A0ABU3GEZ7_9MICO|nr:hypothetical protein [Microbacterium sp. KSW4-11]MDT3318110.1 hypothetical protein [Microbacterium sp. KSW4-11]